MVKQYQGKVRVVYKNLVVHPEAVMEAHLGGCAAARQGKFMAYKHAFWDQGFGAYQAARDPSKLGGENLRTIAKGVGLDLTRFEADIKDAGCQKEIDDDMRELDRFGVNGTPAFFVNGTFIGGALPPDKFKEIIDQRLAVAEASGVPASDYYQKEIFEKGEKKFRSKKDPKPN